MQWQEMMPFIRLCFLRHSVLLCQKTRGFDLSYGISKFSFFSQRMSDGQMEGKNITAKIVLV